MGWNEPMNVFLKRELKRTWPFLVGFGITFSFITKLSLSIKEEDADKYPYLQRRNRNR